MTHLYERTTILMRDGVGLAAVLFRPTAGVAATLIVRTPYGHDLPIGGNGGTYPHLLALLDAGYAVCWVECRGTFKSEGRFRPKVDEVDDGYDTIDWLVSQPWSNGEVASYGMSYFGMTQWAMAVSGHPALKAIAPIMTAMDWYKGVWYSPGGALSPAIVAPWHVVVRLNEHIRNPTSHPNSTELVGTLAAGLMSGNELVEHAPLATHPLFAGPKDDEESPLHEILSHAAYDEYWAAQDYTRLVSKIKAPALIVAGWYDIFIAQSVHDFRALRVQGATAAVRDGSRLIVGPWDHANLDLDALYPVRDFGLAATGGVADLTGEHLAHFARHLKPHESQAMAGGMDDNTEIGRAHV